MMVRLTEQELAEIRRAGKVPVLRLSAPALHTAADDRRKLLDELDAVTAERDSWKLAAEALQRLIDRTTATDNATGKKEA